MARKTNARKLVPDNTISAAVKDLGGEIIKAGLDAKGMDLAVLDVSQVFNLSDYFIILTGRSDRHVQGIANRIQATLAERGIQPVLVEGYDKGHWILLDYGEILVHVFYEKTREIYDLEALWVNARQVDAERDFKISKQAA